MGAINYFSATSRWGEILPEDGREAPRTMVGMDPLETLAIAADLLTVVAAFVTIVTVFSYWRSRPHIKFSPMASTRPYPQRNSLVNIMNTGSGRPVRQISVGWCVLNEDGSASRGTGADPWIDDLNPRRECLIEFRQEPVGGPPPTVPTLVVDVPPESGGVLCEVEFGGPLIPWRRHRRFIWWTHADRVAGLAPAVLAGRKAASHYDAVTRHEEAARGQAEV